MVDASLTLAWWKLGLIAAAMYAWLPLVRWVYIDAQEVRSDELFWSGIIIAAAAGGILLWLLIPVFWIGLALWLIVVGAVSGAYVMHRNSRVADFERILTVEHIKGLFVDQTKKLQKLSRDITFITVNKNEVPLPEPKTRDAEGFVVACEILDDALWRRADKILFIPQKEDYAVIYEIDGIAAKQPSRTKEEMEAFAYFIKECAGLDVQEKRKPQQGRFSTLKNKDQRTDWQIVSSGSTAGEQFQISKASAMVSRKVEELGLNDNQLEPIRSLRQLTGGGVILVTGPAKSGVTTTFYTLLGNHDPFLNSIYTLERAPAAQLPNITQHTYTLSDSGNMTYSRKLQSLLRRGPDIIGVADCQDGQTAQLACMAAKDTKIVYVTFPANSILEALTIWYKWVEDKQLVGQTLTAILNQRLVRILCTECRQPYQPNQALLKKFNIPTNDVGTWYRPGEIEYDKHGKPIVCQHCQGTGFYGRTGLFETIRLDETLRKAVAQAASAQEAVAAFRRAGMLYLQEQAIKKVMQGITSINEIVRIFSAKSQ